MTATREATGLLTDAQAATYADWFACLGEPTRVRMLHAIAAAPGGTTVGVLAEDLGISQSTASHHLRKLADVGFVILTRHGTATIATINAACCTGLPHAADVVMGSLSQQVSFPIVGSDVPCCPTDLPTDVAVRPMREGDLGAVRRIYLAGIATGIATFETSAASEGALWKGWLPEHRWVATIGRTIVGWAAASPASKRACYAGVAETSVYVDPAHQGRGVGKALIHRQVTAADAGDLWTLQASVFPENRASIALHHSAGFRTLGVRDRIAQRNGVWHDTVLLERRRAV